MTRSNYPDLFVVGPQKCGTTTLWGLLRQHLDVFLPEQKETHHFASDGRPPAFSDSASAELNAETVWQSEAYEALYAASNAPLKVEICPTYLFAQHSAERIAAARPDARIVAILRDPIARSFSAYRHMKARGAETARSFEDALAAEADHVARNWQTMSHYTASSLYYPQLKRYYDRFPSEQILIQDFDRLQADPVAVANEVLAFAGAEPLPDGIGVAQTNRTVVLKSGLMGRLLIDQPAWVRLARKLLPRSHRGKMKEWIVSKLPSESEKLTPEMRERLAPTFREDALATRALTGQRFETWTI